MASNSYLAPPPPIFSGENYPIWSVKMQVYPKAYDLWDVVETGKDPAPLSDNPTLTQIKQHSEECAKKFKALSCIHSAVSDVIFTRILAGGSAKEAWDKLKEEYQGTKKVLVCRDVKIDEDTYWNWEKKQVEHSDVIQQKLENGVANSELDDHNSDSDSSIDAPPPKTKSLAEIYERYDLLVTGNDADEIKLLKQQIMSEFEMSDLREMSYFLGFEVNQSSCGIFISQHKYALDLLKKFNLENCKSVATPLVLNEKLEKERWSSKAKRVLRYLKGTADFGILYRKVEEADLCGFSDSDWAGCLDDFKSTLGYAFSLGSGIFPWNSKKQDIVAQSTAEAEYVAVASVANQAIWLRKVITDLKQDLKESTLIFVDNKSTISMIENLVQHGRTKHINVKFHALREVEKNGEIKLVHCSSNEQQASRYLY
ncbi:hypothetical protein GH714_027969 [Hevea brasiliensis]|uniref:Reverse transcriptase Ty1/copia-type domain-containing protein n=1 Tax=Hevea brasiliensis TaxID=3981 RepID=A0A6A6KUF2_HEVBR|nr:hypothetical protein GH714_027969 [Hevea brasiliensis]